MIFVLAGAGKFVMHGAELDAFRRYGLPVPGALVLMIGVVEVSGGLALLFGGAVVRRLAALFLASTMVGAIVVSGIGEGEVVPSLTLAPVLLVAMVWLAWSPRRAGSDVHPVNVDPLTSDSAAGGGGERSAAARASHDG